MLSCRCDRSQKFVGIQFLASVSLYNQIRHDLADTFPSFNYN